jgi:hypothetical protein
VSRFVAVLAAVVLVLCLRPTNASAVPVLDLCTPDGARGGVPADFVLDACVDAASMTLRNDLDVPVLVRRDGDVGVPARVHERGSATASVLRVLAATDELLMPGDVTRWPLGPAAGSLTVADLDPATVGIVSSLGSSLPRLGAEDGDQENFQSFAVVVRETAAAVAARTACIAGKNFLQAAACDVVTASAVSRTVVGQLPRRSATELLPLVLDADHWADWVAPPAEPAPGARTLVQAAVPPPVVVPPPVIPAPPQADPSPAPSVPAPAPAPRLPDLPTQGIDLGAWLEDVLGRLDPERDGTGPGHGNGHGNGRGGR